MKSLPIASYWCSCSDLGSSRLRGSGYAGSSGTYGHLREVKGRSGGAGSGRAASSTSGELYVFD